MPAISIITATCNSASTIGDCLASLRQQTCPAEHIIIDGASIDSTLEIVKNYQTDRAMVVSEPDCGIYDALNKGIKLATGEVIGILHSDDFYAGPDILEKVTRVFENPEVDSCYGDLVYVAEDIGARHMAQGIGETITEKKNFKIVRYWKSGEFKAEKFYGGWMVPHPTFFIRRSVYEKHGLFKLDLGSAADYELMLRFLIKHRITTEYIPEVLVKMRVGGTSNVSLANRIKANRMDRKAWAVNGLKPYPWTLWLKPIRKIGQYFSRPLMPEGLS